MVSVSVSVSACACVRTRVSVAILAQAFLFKSRGVYSLFSSAALGDWLQVFAVSAPQARAASREESRTTCGQRWSWFPGCPVPRWWVEARRR